MKITSTNAGQSRNEGAQMPVDGSHSSGVGRCDQRRFFVEHSDFTTLERSGGLHGYQVEAIVYSGGDLLRPLQRSASLQAHHL